MNKPIPGISNAPIMHCIPHTPRFYCCWLLSYTLLSFPGLPRCFVFCYFLNVDIRAAAAEQRWALDLDWTRSGL